MKKIISIFVLIINCTVITYTQTIPQALGIRFGGSDGVSAEISYQQPAGSNNRFEFDLGFIDAQGFDGLKFTLQYHWVANIEGGFNWYIGPGGSIGVWDIDDDFFPGDDDFNDDGFFLDVVGQIGIEYNFAEVPFQFSLDARPEIGLINDGFDFGYGLGIRFLF
jgi:hypothetical protein